MQHDAGAVEPGPEQLSDRRDQGARAVAHGDDQSDLLAGKYGDGMCGDIARQVGIGRVRQVVAERELDLAARRPDADHDQAAARMESQQIWNDRKHPGHRVNPDARHDARLRRRSG
jgi:hypothetical protein